MRAHPQQQCLVPLPCAVDADIRSRGCRLQAPQRIERLGPRGGPIHGIRVRRRLRISPLEISAHRINPPRVGLERRVERGHEAGAQRMPVELGGHEIAPVAAGAIGVWNVPGGLLEVGHQPPALEHLGHHVRRVLDGEVHAAQLRHRVIAVIVEYLLVQALGASRAHIGRARRQGGPVEELVEKEPPQRLRRSRVPREQRALHGLGQVDQRKHRPRSTLLKYGAIAAASSAENLSHRPRRLSPNTAG